jgi:hypothetical protein
MEPDSREFEALGVAWQAPHARGSVLCRISNGHRSGAGSAPLWGSGVSAEFDDFTRRGHQGGEALSGGGVGLSWKSDGARALRSWRRARRAARSRSMASGSFVYSCFIRCSSSGSRRQLSVDKNERHRGNDVPGTPLLRELEGGAGGWAGFVRQVWSRFSGGSELHKWSSQRGCAGAPITATLIRL